MTLTITGSLQAKEDNVPFNGWRIEVFFEQLVSPVPEFDPKIGVDTTTIASIKTKKIMVPTRTKNALGEFKVDLPDESEIAGKLLFVVYAPSGEVAGEAIFDGAHPLPEDKSVVLQVKAIRPIPLDEPISPSKPVTRRVTGRVFERNGKLLPAGLQVIIMAGKAGADEVPVLAVRADRSGYFFGNVPNEEYEKVTALVAGVPDATPVSLEGGLIPLHIPLLVDLSEIASIQSENKDDCNCGGTGLLPRSPTHTDFENSPETYSVDLGAGGCVQFNKPNRAIEEFDFYSVVRTTMPGIRLHTMGDTNHRPLASKTSTVTDGESVDQLKKDEKEKKQNAENLRATAKTKAGEVESAQTALNTAQTEYRTALSKEAGLKEEYVNAQASYDNIPTGKDDAAQKKSAEEKKDKAYGLWQDAIKITGEIFDNLEKTLGPALGAAIAAKSDADEAVRIAEEEARRATAARQAAEAASTKTGTTTTTHPEEETPARDPRRVEMDVDNPVDWDSTPTFYEAAEIAHGHILHFKQTWYADGYSLGDLLYSLPLAPGQKKLISVIDWERRESTERTEGTFASEKLDASLSRDRDITEVLTGALTEMSRGGSKNITAGAGIGTGAAGNGSYQQFNFGALVGVSGGIGGSESSAWQDSARNLSSNSLQNLRDRTMQSASAVRGLRSSVVHAVSQGETVRATTEVVANHNHCHALTIQYFEVLRHMKVEHELTDVQECLFVPFPMSDFDKAKVLRWRQTLQTYLQRSELASGFDATRRVETNWLEVDYPIGRYADEMITSISGELQLTILIPLPPFPQRPMPNPEDPAGTVQAMADAINPTTGTMGILLAVATGGASIVASEVTRSASTVAKIATQGPRQLADAFYPLTPDERYDKFQKELMPAVAAGFVNRLELEILVGDVKIPINKPDFTLVSEYQAGVPLLVSLRAVLPGQFKRANINQLIIKSSYSLPYGSRAIINSATIRYRTNSFEHVFVDDRRVNDDIDLPVDVPIFDDSTKYDFNIQRVTEGTGATLFTPIDTWEQRNPRKEDERLTAELIDHLNDNLEFYHHAIWWTMDPNRRYMLMDGFAAPGANGLSVASVVENKLIGIVGNSLVLPVARGNHLDPRFGPDAAGEFHDLLDYYSLFSPVPATRLSLPTHGVFAEAVMGTCNACEQIDDSRFWRWEESPIDEPPAIDTASTATRRTQPDSGQPTAFPTPIVSIQNAPSAPNPTGIAAALDALGKQSFADITGLAGTQANAAAAYNKAMDTALQFGKEASTLAQQAAMTKSIDRTMNAIDKAEAGGKISKDDAKQLRVSALKKMVGESSTDDKAKSEADIEHKKAVTKAFSEIPAKFFKEFENRDPSGGVTRVSTTGSEGMDLVSTGNATRFAFATTDTVGENGANKIDDVLALKGRLISLGFDWLTEDEEMDSLTVQTIKLFQAIVNGHNKIVGQAGVNGLIKVNDNVYRWLQATNAPRWQIMPVGSFAEGFFNIERLDKNDQYDFGTNWMSDTIVKAGEDYKRNYLNIRPIVGTTPALLTVNDVSLPRGGFTSQHKGHQTGLNCDIRLPNTDGTAPGGVKWCKSVGSNNVNPNYDRDAMRAMLIAIKAQPLWKLTYFNDPVLISEGLCARLEDHDDHAHFEIKPPQKGGIELLDIGKQQYTI